VEQISTAYFHVAAGGFMYVHKTWHSITAGWLQALPQEHLPKTLWCKAAHLLVLV